MQGSLRKVQAPSTVTYQGSVDCIILYRLDFGISSLPQARHYFMRVVLNRTCVIGTILLRVSSPSRGHRRLYVDIIHQ